MTLGETTAPAPQRTQEGGVPEGREKLGALVPGWRSRVSSIRTVARSRRVQRRNSGHVRGSAACACPWWRAQTRLAAGISHGAGVGASRVSIASLARGGRRLGSGFAHRGDVVAVVARGRHWPLPDSTGEYLIAALTVNERAASRGALQRQ